MDEMMRLEVIPLCGIRIGGVLHEVNYFLHGECIIMTSVTPYRFGIDLAPTRKTDARFDTACPLEEGNFLHNETLLENRNRMIVAMADSFAPALVNSMLRRAMTKREIVALLAPQVEARPYLEDRVTRLVVEITWEAALDRVLKEERYRLLSDALGDVLSDDLAIRCNDVIPKVNHGLRLASI